MKPGIDQLPEKDSRVQRLGGINMSYEQVIARMINYSQAVNSAGINYWPTGPNSNSYAFSFARNLGFNPQPALSSPGWNKNLNVNP